LFLFKKLLNNARKYAVNQFKSIYKDKYLCFEVSTHSVMIHFSSLINVLKTVNKRKQEVLNVFYVKYGSGWSISKIILKSYFTEEVAVTLRN
jgi:hypothetical protein